MKTRLRRIPRGDAGLSLVEVLVAMVLSTLIMTLVVSFFVQTTRVTSEANANRTTVSNNMTVYNAITSRVRVAGPAIFSASSSVAVIEARSDYLSFYAWTETTALAPQLSRVVIDATSSGNPRVTTCEGTQAASGFWTFPCATPKVQTFEPRFVAASSGQSPLFTYRDRCDNPPATASGRVTDPSTVQSVIVSVKTKTAGTADSTAAYLTAPIYLSNVKTIGNC